MDEERVYTLQTAEVVEKTPINTQTTHTEREADTALKIILGEET